MFLTALFLAAGLAGQATPGKQASGNSDRRPSNIVVVVVDDASFTDFGAYGSEIRTPNIDRLAARGVRFTNFHASPMCSPSRAMLLTGVDSHTAGVASLYEATPLRHRGKPGYEGQLRPEVTTIATRLQQLGYRTYLTGKWNLGHTPENLPSARGFDRTFALDATGADNFEKKPYLPLYKEVPWFADGQPTDLPDDFYSSEFLVDKMIEFMAEDQTGSASERGEQPFFAYLAFQAIHIPIQAPREFIERYEGVYERGWEWLREERYRQAIEAGVIPPDSPAPTTPTQRDWDSLSDPEKALFSKSMAVQAGMLEAMDFHLGRLMAYLEERGRAENTIFFVLSDNGPEAGNPAASGKTFSRWLDSVGYRRDLETLGERGSYAFIGPDFATATAGPLSYYKFHGGEGGVRVPLIVSGAGIGGNDHGDHDERGPGLAGSSRAIPAGTTATSIETGTRGRSTAAFAFITDVVPTILDLLQAPGVSSASVLSEGSPPLVGKSLLPLLVNTSGAGVESTAVSVHEASEPVAFETAGHAGVFKGDLKLVRVGAPAGDGVWRLFNLAVDPGETLDLAAQLPERFAELSADYEAYAERVGVLDLPASYSPTRQLGINMIYGRVLENLVPLFFLGLFALLLSIMTVRVVRRLLQKRRETGAINPRSFATLKKRILVTLAVALSCVALFVALLPTLLRTAGLHPAFEGESPELLGKRALVITTSHSVLNAPGETTGKATGVFGSEMTVPYYAFQDAGMQVDVASIRGGNIPIDPQSFLFMVRTKADERFQEDPDFKQKVENSMRIDDVDFTQYDSVYLAGGWGAAYDLGASEVLGQKVSEAYYAKTPIIGSVCHGALGLIRAKTPEGELLVAGRRMTGVTDKQVRELGIDMTPMHPENELRKAGAIFEASTAFRDAFANHVVVDDEGRFVTGQNQNGGHETAHKMMMLISELGSGESGPVSLDSGG